MTLFSPPQLGCPICNTDPHSFGSSSIGAFLSLSTDHYRSRDCGHEFSLFDALRAGCRGLFGVVSTFTHWSHSSTEQVVVGRINTIVLKRIPEGHIFATFLTPYGHPDDAGSPLLYLAEVLRVSGNELLVSTSVASQMKAEAQGQTRELGVSVYAHTANDTRGWVRLLYESLTDYSRQRFQLSLFKLATCLEIACDQAIERYLTSKQLPPSMVKRLIRGARGWDDRIARLHDIAGDFLSATETIALNESVKLVQESVRSYRNAFAHDDAQSPNHRATTRAFQVAFPLVWAVDKILTKLQWSLPATAFQVAFTKRSNDYRKSTR